MSTTNSALYVACENNDIVQVRQLLQTLAKDELNEQGPNNRTALHIAALHGHTEILELLLANQNIDRTIKNQYGNLAKDEVSDQLTYLFDRILVINDDDDDDDIEESIEWFDAYKNAYRIACENHTHLKRWLTKVSFDRLVNEIDTGYIDNINFDLDKIDQKTLIKNYMKQAIENNDPLPIVRAYTEKTRFVTKLNEDLATNGSDFRFQISFAMMNTIFSDSDPPKGFGHYIFVAILSHHHKLKQYRHYTGITYRGMNVKKSDLDQYEEGKLILTRTFLSSSINQQIANNFLIDNSMNLIGNHRVICIYHIRNPTTTLDLHTISTYPNENEILIMPFMVFKITNIKRNLDDITYIELDECET